MIFIGIDPGSGGGMVALEEAHGGSDERATQLGSMTLPDIWGWVSYLSPRRDDGRVFAVIERVGGYVSGDQGRPGMGASMFNFGASFGGLRMALVAAAIPFEEVVPQRWQAEFGMKRAKGEASTAWKNRLKQKAQQLFPRRKITLATADAFLLAEYCRRKFGRGGEPPSE